MELVLDLALMLILVAMMAENNKKTDLICEKINILSNKIDSIIATLNRIDEKVE